MDKTNNKQTTTATTEPDAEAAEAAPGRQLLTPKALDLMERIADYGYLTMHEVRFVFGNKTWAYKVVKELRAQGLIADFETLMSPRTAHYLTARGHRALAQMGRPHCGRRFAPERYSPFIFQHRMACAKAGLRLAKHPLVHDFLPESRLWKRRKSEAEKLCDGEFLYRIPGDDRSERVGLEVELNLKNSDKLDESFRELYRRGDLDQVWWLCGDEGVRRGLRRALLTRPVLDSQRHFFALFGEFLAAKGKAELMDPRGSLLSIDPEKPTLLLRPLEPAKPIEEPKPARVREQARAEAASELEPARERREVAVKPGPEPVAWRPKPIKIKRPSDFELWLAEAWRTILWVVRETILLVIKLIFLIAVLVLAGSGVWYAYHALKPEPKPEWEQLAFVEQPDRVGVWGISRAKLDTLDGRYRLWLRLINESYAMCGLLKATVEDEEGEVLGTWKIGRWRWHGRRWDQWFVFRPKSEPFKKFFVEFSGEGWDCWAGRIPIEFEPVGVK